MSLRTFYTDPYLHIRAFTVQWLVAVAICVLLWHLRTPEFFAFDFAWWQPLVYLPLAFYLGGISSVFIHNATHHSFHNKWLNFLCGHLAGMHQLWGFTGWRLIHLVHHHYSDDAEQDPHPPRGRTYWQFTRDMFVQSSFTISKRYREHWKDTPRTRMLQRMVFIAFTLMGTTLLVMWYLLLGPEAFVFFYLPSLVVNHLLFSHINYYCHPADPQTGQTAAANLDHHFYYKLANAIWFGIYFHGNHHRKPMLFNPRKMSEHAKA